LISSSKPFITSASSSLSLANSNCTSTKAIFALAFSILLPASTASYASLALVFEASNFSILGAFLSVFSFFILASFSSGVSSFVLVLTLGLS